MDADIPKHGWKSPEHVALMLLGTPTEQRGNFIIAIADYLYSKGQNFTGRLLREAGETYNKTKTSERK